MAVRRAHQTPEEREEQIRREAVHAALREAFDRVDDARRACLRANGFSSYLSRLEDIMRELDGMARLA